MGVGAGDTQLTEQWRHGGGMRRGRLFQGKRTRGRPKGNPL